MSYLITWEKTNFISMMDLTQGYWQVPVAKKDQHKTVFNTLFGFFNSE